MGTDGQIAAVTVNMACPLCGLADVPADSQSSWVIAWFTCQRCGHDWSARLRGGHPDIGPGLEISDRVDRVADPSVPAE